MESITEAEIYVVENGSCWSLGRKTAKALGILNINTAVWEVNDDHTSSIEKVFAAVSNAEIEPGVKLVQQTRCRTPISLRKRAERGMQGLPNQEIVKKASRDSTRFSRIVVRPKKLRPNTEVSVVDVENQLLEDQKRFLEKIASLGGKNTEATPACKGNQLHTAQLKELKVFGVECASSRLAVRRRCGNSVLKTKNVAYTPETTKRLLSAIKAGGVPAMKLKAE
ncbi:conserved hypothetical protein [Culex quinquefasciatus]|uniref:Uncharacterized protein n=1 Tax=Culex quinquefasciatus TaxID=7176 RepID=B0X9V6_CULQU|nr:conserved hypothetical protein [Culex quinquefasciatus]|eukprot:XP_001866428.1 conserved hypothetical protein [Culex quinquefasciatus]